MKNPKQLIAHIADKLDQSERGYSVPQITYSKIRSEDNSQYLILEFPDGKRFMVGVSQL
jgi:hypothetical protein